MPAKMGTGMTTAKRWSATLWEFLAVVAITGLAALVRWERLGTRNLWPDEAHSLDVARRGIRELLAFVRAEDAHPFGYYALLSSWIRWVGEDLASMRALSAIFGVASVLGVWWLGRRLFSPAVGVGAAALLALNPFQIFASNELRMYMPLEFLALVSTALLWRARVALGHGWWIAYGVSLAMMAYVSYYAFLLIPAHLTWIFLHEKPRIALRRIGVAAATAAVLFAPWIPSLLTQGEFLRSTPLLWRGQTIWPTYVPELVAAQTFGGYVLNAVSYHSTQALELKYYGLLLFPFVLLAGVGFRALGAINRPARTLVALAWVVPAAVVVLVSLALGKVAAYHYHLNFLAPFLALFVAAGVVHLRDAVTEAPVPVVMLGATVGVLAFMAPAIENLQGNPEYQFYRYDLAARLVKNLYQPGDVVVFLPRGISRGFHFYFDPPGRELGVRLELHTYSRESLRGSIREVAQSLTLEDRKVWLVYSPPIPDGALEDLLKAIEEQGYKRAVVNDFKGLRVGLFVRPVK